MIRPLILGAMLFALSAGPAFGATVMGDFDGDGKADLAVGAPTEDLGIFTDAGAVHVIYGSPDGLSASGNQLFTQDTAGIVEDAEIGDQFGHTLAAGDFNGDGFSDLAIGAPFEDFAGNDDLGVVHVIYGTPTGLDPLALGKEADTFSTDPVSYESSQEFGYALAAGNFGQGAPADLAVGSPGDDFVELDAGTVAIFYGNVTGIDLATTAVFGQGTTDVPGVPNQSESFGKALVAADFGEGPQADLAVGVPRDDVGNVGFAGGVNVLYGTSSGIQAADGQRWTQNSSGIAGRAGDFDGFGASLAAGNMGKSPQADLAIAAPCEDIRSSACAGAVNVIYAGTARLSAAGDQYWSQATPGVTGRPRNAEGFGLAMTAADFGRSARADLAIASDEMVGSASSAGAVQIFYGTRTGLTAQGDQLFSQATDGIADRPQETDGFGRALGAGNFGRGQYADLAIGIPNEDRDGSIGAGAVQLLYGRQGGLGVRNAELLDQDSPGILETIEEGDGFGFSLGPRGSGLGVRYLP